MEKSFIALGTKNTISIECQNAERIIDHAILRVNEIEQKMSAFIENSEISAIKQNAGIKLVSLSSEVFDILDKSLTFSKLSKGAFDITIGPLTRLWNIGNGSSGIPARADIENAKRVCGYKNLTLDSKNKTAYLKRSGSSIDLGGIAKGYAADEVRRILHANGVNSGKINLGGNIVCVGCRSDGLPWKIGIQNPLSFRGDYAAAIDVSDQAAVTSAVNERFFVKDGKRYHHILDPRTGCPANSGLLSVTVISGNSADCDMLSTGAFVMGMEAGLPLIKRFNADAIFITVNGDIFSTIEIWSKQNLTK